MLIGRNPVVEALRAKVPAKALYVQVKMESDDRWREALRLAVAFNIPVLEVSHTDMDRLTETAVEEALGYKEQGFPAVKMKIGLGSMKKDLDRIGAVREALGSDILLMVDANHCYNVPQAIQIGREMEKLGIHWFEEPVSPEDLDGYAEVSQALDMQVAGGENEFTKFSFREIINRRAMDIIQPDVSLCGGFAECLFIAEMGRLWGVPTRPHCWGGGVDVAATLHLLALLPEASWARTTETPMLELDTYENPFRDDLVTTPAQVVDGFVAVPTGPGLGIEIVEELIERYRIG